MKDNVLKCFLEPGSVAVIGASQTPGRGGYGVVKNLLEWKFEGSIFPVNPGTDEILGCKCYESIRSVSEKIDLAVIVVQPHLVLNVVEECGVKGVKAVIIVTGGFGDAGEAGKREEKKVIDTAKQMGIRIIGPNTQGVFNPSRNLVTGYMPIRREEVSQGPVSFVSQSGMFFRGLNLGLCKSVDLANMCDVDHAEVLEYLGEDPDTKAIVLHIEQIRDGKRFMDVAREVTRKKPVLALKTGRSAVGAQAVSSHTGCLAGADESYSAAFKRAGVLRVRDLDELRDYGRAFSVLPLMKGKRVGILSFSGAAGILGADACFDHAMEVANLCETTLEVLRRASPLWAQIMNPVDIWPSVLSHGVRKAFETGLEILLRDQNVDGVLCNYVAADRSTPWDISDIVERIAGDHGKPIVLWAGGSAKPFPMKGTVRYPSIWRAVRALWALYQRWTSLERLHRAHTP